MRSSPHPFRRNLGLATIGVLAASVVAPAMASTAVAAPLEAATEVIASEQLSVTVSTAFPQVVSYQDVASSAVLDGKAKPLTEMLVNGEMHDVEVSATTQGSAVDYQIAFPGIPGALIDARLSVAGNIVTFEVTAIKDGTETQIRSLQIPGHDLVSVASDDAGAEVSTAKLSVDRNATGDTFEPITEQTQLDAAPKSSAFALANTDQLAAALESNALYDTSSGPGYRDQGRFWRQAVADGDQVRMGLSSGQWLYRADESTEAEELPWTKVAITADANADGEVDWQDGAVAFRDIAVMPNKGDDVKEKVVQRIPFNFASQATHPFLRTLDDTKRIALGTDGLGQSVLLKGFGNEGHDSANTDFADNYNTRAGGLEDLNKLLEAGEEWNASFGVHINQTEAYPESLFFDTEQWSPASKGWNWLDQSYIIDQRSDILSGTLAERVAKFREQTHPNLDMVYVDVYYQFGWLADRLQKELIANDFRVASEWSYSLARHNTWSHWATDETYGGATNKGINSDIMRFALNSQKDTWNPHPLLGNANIAEWEGWRGENSYDEFYRNIWTRNLPTKFIQHHEILEWDDERIALTDDVVVTGTSAEDRVISVGGVDVLTGGTYLLPWANEGEAAKLYHYNPEGGTTTWTLPEGFDPEGTYTVSKLTDQGRTDAVDVVASAGEISLEAQAHQPYVLTSVADDVPADEDDQTDKKNKGKGNGQDRAKSNGLAFSQGLENGQGQGLERALSRMEVRGKGAEGGGSEPEPAVVSSILPENADFGEGTPVEDPGFNSGSLDPWAPEGEVTIERNDLGHTFAQFGEGPGSLTQSLGTLDEGTHSVSAWVEVEPGRERDLTLSVSGAGDQPVTNTVSSSGAANYVAADEKNGMHFQRVRVLVDSDGSTQPVLTLAAGEGSAPVRVDDIRVVATERVATEGVLSEDFENVDQGWGPFIKGNAGGSTDPRTHLSELNAPYTQAGWNGKLVDDVIDGDWSLKAHEENRAPGGGPGLVYRTSNYTLPMTPGHEYRISFDYQNSHDDQYRWVGGYDSASGPVQTDSDELPQARSTERFEQTLVAGSCGEAWVGLERSGRSGGADFILDNLLVEDLGASDEVPACAQFDVATPLDALVQGEENQFTTKFTSDEPETINDLAVELALPEGWTATAETPATADALAPGETLTTTWQVVPPLEADGDYTVGASASYQSTTDPAGLRTIDAELGIYTLPKPPVAPVYASDHQWVSAENGWGPVERDMANGGRDAADGPALTLGGVTYEKGLGAHASSNIEYYTGGNCSRFTAMVGVDDSQGSSGTVVFSVLADGEELIKTPLLGNSDDPVAIDVDISGAENVNLVVGTGPDGNGNDHADWADARFDCAPDGTTEPPSDPVAPAGTAFASDLEFLSESNGWGPVERDQSNGEKERNDGGELSIRGETFAKGLGTHADSSVEFFTGGQCVSFAASVGIDDSRVAKKNGSVIFTVVGDGQTLAETPLLTWESAVHDLTVDIAGIERVTLAADVNGDDGGDDHANWGDATFECAE